MSEKQIIPVNGFRIRNTLDDNFAILHTHNSGINTYLPKFYIPLNEIWVDYPYLDEADFLIEIDKFTEPDGKHSFAEKRAQAKEKFCKKGPLPDFTKKEEKKDGLTIKYMDGKVVREYLDPEFVLGGHDLVYSYIPEREVWLDAKMDPEELPYILHHELIERELMAKGKSYDVAHEYATVSDMEMRRERGVGFYPGDPNYPWETLAHDEIIKEQYVLKPKQ